jgi:hypothetical protein
MGRGTQGARARRPVPLLLRARALTSTRLPPSRKKKKHDDDPNNTQSGILYPVVVRFDTQNYAGTTTNNFGLDEVKQM